MGEILLYMRFLNNKFEKTEIGIIRWMAANGLTLLRLSIGIIFLWFGFLKYFQGLSPAEDLAIRTIDTISFGLFPEKMIIYGLATWEVAIGIGFLFNVYMRATLVLLFLQMTGTFFPLFLFLPVRSVIFRG